MGGHGLTLRTAADLAAPSAQSGDLGVSPAARVTRPEVARGNRTYMRTVLCEGER
jgi:hypothetical protein